MSVTFSIDFLATGKFEFNCYTTSTTFGPFDSYDEGLLAATAHKMECVDCDCYGAYVNAIADVSDEFDVNLSNSNAGMILGILGIQFEELWGSMPADDFLGRVLLSLAQDRNDAAVPATVDKQPGHATWIDCDLPAGYTTTVLTALERVAREANTLGRHVVWS